MMRGFLSIFVVVAFMAMVGVYIARQILGLSVASLSPVWVWSILALGVVVIGLAILLQLLYPTRRPLDRDRLSNTIIGMGLVNGLVIFLLGGVFLTKDILMGLIHLFFAYPEYINTGVVVGIVSFAVLLWMALMYGHLIGRYRYQVEHVEIQHEDVPPAFDGFRIVQVSDFHSGNWDSMTQLARGIDLIQRQDADMIVFTGDLVNADKDEIDPFIDMWAGLTAPYGKYAVLGNHDYTGKPKSSDLRPAYFADFFNKFNRMGWQLLLNEHRRIHKDGAQLTLAGVENWGNGRYFPKRGDIGAALQGSRTEDFCILLSHDPSHWTHHVLRHDQHIHLTLSGHTHGMQFGINTKFLKWSPIQWSYKNWIGKYEDQGRYLYVNRGFGVLGFLGRVGMWPEITVIELRRTVR